MRIKGMFILSVFLLGSSLTGAKPNEQTLNKGHEKILISFQLQKNHKIMTVSVAEDESYIVYRFGTKDKIELEFPKEKKDSWMKFKYSHYQRPMQGEAEGLELDYLYFETNGFTYKIFQEFSESASSSSTQYGIRISNHKSKQVTEMLADPKSVIGNLADLQDNDKIMEGEYVGQ